MIKLEALNDNQTFEGACCTFYEDKIVQILLGSSFHPGGLSLTKELGLKVKLSPSDRILDLASGLGSSAIHIAQTFGSNVIGIDFSKENIKKSTELSLKKKVDHLVSFQVANVENLKFEDNSFDYVLCECSFCLFGEKNTVGKEIFRILKPKGSVILTDIAIEKPLPFELDQLIYKVACVANALSINGYKNYFTNNGFNIKEIQGRKDVLLQLTEDIKKKAFLLEMASGLKKINLKKEDIKEIKNWIHKAKELILDGSVTYMTMIATKK